MSVASQAKALFHLQELDLHIIHDQKRLKAIAAELEDNQAIALAQTQVDNAQSQLTPLQKRSRDIELEIQSNSQKAKSTGDQLYSGNVKNPKELQDMQQEIAALNKRNSQLEDALLDLMIEVEEAENVLASAQNQLSAATNEWEAQHQDLLEEQSGLQAAIASFQEQREQAAHLISTDNIRLYNQLRPQKHNRPIAAIEGKSCSVCGVEQNSSVVQDVRRALHLVNCESCGRILISV